MSLLVARREGNSIYIVSDTKLTYPANHPIKMISNPRDGVIKITILNPNICVGFAGNVEDAELAIAHCRNFSEDASKILSYLLEVNRSTNKQTEFIMLYNSWPRQLFVIKDAKLDIVESTCWIGSLDGFNLFQEEFYKVKTAKKGVTEDSLSLAEDAFTKVCESSTVPEVNGFRITVQNKSGRLSYSQYINMNIVSQVIPPGMSVIGHSNAQQGGYSVNVFPDPDHPNIVPIYILQGRFGIVYSQREKGFLYPKVYSDVFEYEFHEIVKSEYGISYQYCISSKHKACYERGVIEANKKDWEKALSAINKGLNEEERNYKPDLYFTKAIVLFNINRQNEGALLFNEAVKLKPSLQPEIFNFLAVFNKRLR